MDYRKLLESDSLSQEELSAMKKAAYSSMPYKFYRVMCELNKPAVIENADLFKNHRQQAIELLNTYKNYERTN